MLRAAYSVRFAINGAAAGRASLPSGLRRSVNWAIYGLCPEARRNEAEMR
jgi:hypothetical protein